MVKFPAWLNGTSNKITIPLSKPKKCPNCGSTLYELRVDSEDNYCCGICDYVIRKSKKH